MRPLGAGGFAQVFLYEQDMPRRVVAVKVLDAAEGVVSTDTMNEQRLAFEAEADVMARLSSHPSIVSIYQASIALDGRPYLVMEFCPESMGARTKATPAPLHVVLDAGVRIAGALETAHRADLLHRDIKPSNVLLTTLGRPVLSDFGISRQLQDTRVDDGGVAMSIPWSAPEIVQLTSTGSVSSEIWSLAATLYSFAAGRSPFEHQDRAQNSRSKLMARIAKAHYAAIPGAVNYEPFDAVLARALSRDPRARFETMAEFGAALQQLQRSYGYDVTPLDVVAAAWLPRTAVTETTVRGPIVSSVGQTQRSLARAAAREQSAVTDEDGLLVDRQPSALRAGLVGAGVAIAAMLVVGGTLWALFGGAG